MEIQTSSKDTSELLDRLAKKMKTKVIHDYAECELKIPAKFGKGSIYSFEYDGVSMLMFNAFLKEDLNIVFLASKEQPLRVSYCVKGNIRHVFYNRKLSCTLEEHTGSITANPSQHNELFYYPAQTQLSLTLLQVNRKKYFHRIEDELPSLPTPLANAFLDLKAKETFFYRSNYDVGLIDCIESMERTDKKGMIRSLFMESKVLELFYLSIKRYEEDFEFPSRRSLLKKKDQELILKARDFLVKDISKNITIPELAKKVGINQQKLKTGFKSIFNKTIAAYLLEERLEKARQLLVTGALTVREVSEHIGYANQSHFARRFKEKYGLLPKEFMNKNKH